jgi:hypothetical protein
MYNSGKNKYNVQSVCPYYPEDYLTFVFTQVNANTAIYTAPANTVLLAFGYSFIIRGTGGNGLFELKLRESDDTVINIPLQGYVLENNNGFGNGVFIPPVEVSPGRDLYLYCSNIGILNLSLLCVERSCE